MVVAVQTSLLSRLVVTSIALVFTLLGDGSERISSSLAFTAMHPQNAFRVTEPSHAKSTKRQTIALPLVDFPVDNNVYSSSSSSGATPLTSPKVGVLLLNLGGPETGDDVEGSFGVIFLLIVECLFVLTFKRVPTIN
jgi:hypothetical protein